MYGKSKLSAPSTVTGIFAKQMQQGLSLTITNDGNQRRDFTYVGDVVDANLLAAKHNQKLNKDSQILIFKFKHPV